MGLVRIQPLQLTLTGSEYELEEKAILRAGRSLWLATLG